MIPLITEKTLRMTYAEYGTLDFSFHAAQNLHPLIPGEAFALRLYSSHPSLHCHPLLTAGA